MKDATAERAVRARLAARPGSTSTAQLALFDHHMVPGRADVRRWIADATRQGFTSLRTSALFPESRAAFLDAGFATIDRLALLEFDLSRGADRPARRTTSRLRTRDLAGAAAIDQAAFGPIWGNTADALAEIGTATPHHRSRVIRRTEIVAFAISGRAGRTGYVQRLAVHPDQQGAGLGRALLDDALAWMTRHGVASALVNTGVDNVRALALYLSAGFEIKPDELVVLERSLDR